MEITLIEVKTVSGDVLRGRMNREKADRYEYLHTEEDIRIALKEKIGE